MTIVAENTQLELLAARAVFWPAANTLFVADLHLGKSDFFRKAGISISTVVNQSVLARLTELFSHISVQRLVVLGDFWHAAGGITPAAFKSIAAWRKHHAAMEIDVVLGNHDRGSDGPLRKLNMRVHPHDLDLEPLRAAHLPVTHPARFTLAGHLHPAVQLRGRGRQCMTLRCFLCSPGLAVLPAFGDFTGSAVVPPQPDDRVFAIAGTEIVEVAHPERNSTESTR